VELDIPPVVTEAAPREQVGGQEVPVIPGIDTRAGLRRVNGNTTLYRTLLLKFHDSQRDVVQRIRTALDRSDPATACRDAHSLKGVSGNLGAERLQALARNLETAIENNNGEVEHELGLVAETLNTLIGELAKVAAAPEETPAVAPDSARIGETMGRLRSLLEDNDGDAVEALEELSPNLRGTQAEPLIRGLRDRVGNYRFEEALPLLDEVERVLMESAD
jgi:HPt (histidine-containing phosphotransfer) domain-containing protein